MSHPRVIDRRLLGRGLTRKRNLLLVLGVVAVGVAAVNVLAKRDPVAPPAAATPAANHVGSQIDIGSAASYDPAEPQGSNPPAE